MQKKSIETTSTSLLAKFNGIELIGAAAIVGAMYKAFNYAKHAYNNG